MCTVRSLPHQIHQKMLITQNNNEHLSSYYSTARAKRNNLVVTILLPKGNLPITLSTCFSKTMCLHFGEMALVPPDVERSTILRQSNGFSFMILPPQASWCHVKKHSCFQAWEERIPRLLYHPTVVLPLSNPYMKQKLVQSTAGSNIEIPSPVTNYMGMEPPPPYSSHLLDWERQPVDSSTPQGGLASSDSKSGLRHRDQ